MNTEAGYMYSQSQSHAALKIEIHPVQTEGVKDNDENCLISNITKKNRKIIISLQFPSKL